MSHRQMDGENDTVDQGQRRQRRNRHRTGERTQLETGDIQERAMAGDAGGTGEPTENSQRSGREDTPAQRGDHALHQGRVVA